MKRLLFIKVIPNSKVFLKSQLLQFWKSANFYPSLSTCIWFKKKQLSYTSKVTLDFFLNLK